jgi:hypothetical protein
MFYGVLCDVLVIDCVAVCVLVIDCVALCVEYAEMAYAWVFCDGGHHRRK